MESRKNSGGRKIYRCKAKIEMPAKLMIEAITDTDHVTEWNTTLTDARVLKKLNDDCAISYQVTFHTIEWHGNTIIIMVSYCPLSEVQP